MCHGFPSLSSIRVAISKDFDLQFHNLDQLAEWHEHWHEETKCLKRTMFELIKSNWQKRNEYYNNRVSIIVFTDDDYIYD